jgi:hypothetical protein
VACLTEFQCTVYADGELSAREVREVDEHLEECVSCRKLVEALRVENRVLVECFQSTDFIEFELEDETLSAPQVQSLGVVRFAAFVLAMSVLLRPVLAVLEELGLPETVNWLVILATYILPGTFRFLDSVVGNAGWIAVSAVLVLGIVLFSRRSVLKSSLLSLLALLTVFSSPSYGIDFRRSDKPVLVPSGETLDDTLVVAGDSVTVDGTITGDLIAFVREVTIRGRVKGNLISLARNVQLEGTVEGSAIGIAQSLDTRGQVAHNIYALAQTADINPEAHINENATLFAAESTIGGTIGKDVFARAGSVNVSSPARIGGRFTARVNRAQNVYIAPGAMIAGKTDIQTPRPAPSKYSTLSFYVWQTIWLTAAFLTGLVLFWVVPALSRVRLDNARQLLETAGAGFLALIAPPAAASVAAITVVGLPLGLIAFSAWIVAAYAAKIVVAGFLGRSLLVKGGDSQPATALILVAGLIPIFIAINLPYIGALINFLLIVLGLGMLVLTSYRTTLTHSAA